MYHILSILSILFIVLLGRWMDGRRLRKLNAMSLPPACSATAATRLNDSVYELHKPGVESLLEVVLVHGLQSSHTSVAHLSTWTSRGCQKEVWPMTWLPEDFPGARILSVNYDACITTSAEHGRLDLYCIAENLMINLISAKVGQDPWRPVILVGHSYGGLVIKQMCLQAHLSKSLRPSGFLNCVKGIFFYGTPHHGMSSFLSPNGIHLKDASPLVYDVKLLGAQPARLHQAFDALRVEYKWSIAGVGESKPTKFPTTEAGSQNAVSSEMIVEEASARYGYFTMEREDHVTLCQPESRTSNTYTRLTEFIQSIDDNKVNWKRLGNFQVVPKMAMSLHSHLFEEVRNILRVSQVVGLCGMGGIGKTTLAKLLFNNLCVQFEYTCFVPGHMLKGDQIVIERQVYSSMYHHGKQVAEIGNKNWEPTALNQKTLLLVLDDIDNDRHDELLKKISFANDCANSRYIVTSRDMDILNRTGTHMHSTCVYAVVHLNLESSKELFIDYAKPHPSFMKWVDKIVAKCEGLPLTLEVMGKYLLNKDRESIWRQCLEALVEADNIAQMDDRLWTKLKVSYDRLDDQEKEIFLDAASFFNNSTWKLHEAKSCWRVLYRLEDVRWQTLVDMSLVYNVGENESIKMHEQLRSLGIRLASGWGTGGRCRTWTAKNVPSRFNSSNFNGRIAEVQFYSSDPGTRSSSTGMETHIEEVIALRLEDSMPLNWRDICQMKNLRYLDSEKELMLDEEGGKLPKNLVLLRWRGKVDNVYDLVFRGFAGQLVVLDLKAPLTCLPTTISEFQNLEILKLEGCLFKDLPETLGQLWRLRVLKLYHCSIQSLPDSMDQLNRLQILIIHECRGLHVLTKGLTKRLTGQKMSNIRTTLQEKEETYTGGMYYGPTLVEDLEVITHFKKPLEGYWFNSRIVKTTYYKVGLGYSYRSDPNQYRKFMTFRQKDSNFRLL